jgi:hypothetical protein
MSLTRRVWGRGRVLCAAMGMVGVLSGTAAAQDAQDPNPGNMTITAAMDFANTYMFRGIRQDDTKVIMWPAADLGLSLYSGEGGLKSVGVNLGVWNSLHTGAAGSDSASGKMWYEGDFYATLGLGFGGGASLATTYTAYTSPNSLFTTVKEIAFKLAVDDSARMGKAAFKPYVLMAFEFDTDTNTGQADGGLEAGRYLELGVAPGWAGTAVSLAFPIKVGMSLSNYYETPGTFEDEGFGYFSVAATATVPLTGVPSSFGSWNLHAGLEFQKLGDSLTVFNNGEDTKGIVSAGIGFSY